MGFNSTDLLCPQCKVMMHYITLKKNFDINDVMERFIGSFSSLEAICWHSSTVQKIVVRLSFY